MQTTNFWDWMQTGLSQKKKEAPKVEVQPYNFQEANEWVRVRQQEKERIEKEKMQDMIDRANHNFKPTQFVHPNDPSVARTPMKKVNHDVSDQLTPEELERYYASKIEFLKNPILRQQWFQQRAYNYANGIRYLQQRGPVYYKFDNPKNREWIARAQSIINEKVNDPYTITTPYWINQDTPKPDRFIMPNEKSQLEIQDGEYERIAKQRVYREQHKNDYKFSLDAAGISKSRSFDKLPVKDRLSRIHNNTTPWVNPDFVTNAATNANNQIFSVDETQSAYNANMDMYNAQVQALRGRAPDKQLYQQPPKAVVNPYIQPPPINYAKPPEFIPGYGYSGLTVPLDQNGLPLVWFNDMNKYLEPTKKEIERGEVNRLIRFKSPEAKQMYLADKKEKQMQTKEKNKEKHHLRIKFMKMHLHDDGSKEFKMWVNNVELTKEQIHEEFNKETYADQYERNAKILLKHPPKLLTDLIPDPREYRRMIKNAAKQLTADDSIPLARELARYNEYVADNLLWFKDNLSPKDYKNLKEFCLDQLMKYRDADPMAIIKSTVMIARNQTIVIKEKPTTLEEIDRMIDKTLQIKGISLEARQKVLKIRAFDTLEEKKNCIQAIRDLEVIPRSEDNALKIINKLEAKLDKMDSYNRGAYLIWKKMFKVSLNPDEIEEKFEEWWKYPRRFVMKKDDYEDAYKNRMNLLNVRRFSKLTENSVPIEYYFERARQRKADEWNREMGYRFNNPNMTPEEFVKALNYSMARMETRKAMEYNKKVQHEQLIRNMQPAMNEMALRRSLKPLYGGLDPGAAAMYYDPDDTAYACKPDAVIPNPELPLEERRRRFIDRLFQKESNLKIRGSMI